ncbi:MAG: hypothetical protein WEA75_07320 [Acidimicrobiia bacterium]
MGGEPQHPGNGGPVLRFADTARRLGAAARAAGLVVPAFRCPPRVPGARRTVRRFPGGSVVSVALKGRTFGDVATDMVEGVLVVNKLEGEAAQRFRTALSDAAGLPSVEARMAERQTRAA